MRVVFFFVFLFVIGCTPGASALKVKKSRQFATGVAGFVLSIPTLASASSLFEGKYSDPINHPGGTRTIVTVGEKVGGYQLAKVNGGGGKGEPTNYVLPAIILNDQSIIIDFSPKGGPKDFSGMLDGKNIKFTRDGNVWPRLE